MTVRPLPSEVVALAADLQSERGLRFAICVKLTRLREVGKSWDWIARALARIEGESALPVEERKRRTAALRQRGHRCCTAKRTERHADLVGGDGAQPIERASLDQEKEATMAKKPKEEDQPRLMKRTTTTVTEELVTAEPEVDDEDLDDDDSDGADESDDDEPEPRSRRRK